MAVLALRTVLDLAPTEVENHRASRYRADEQALALSELAEADRPVVVELYATLARLEPIVAHDLEDPAPLVDFLAESDLNGLLGRVQRLGAEKRTEQVAEALHDIRGGALTTLFVQLFRASRARYRVETGRAIHIAVRDHMKMMRNVLLDIDEPARARDLAAKPHSLGDLSRALREFTVGPAEAQVSVDVHCEAEGVIAESCVECAAIDRVAYNLLNNAARHADRPALEAWLLTLDHDLRVAIANSISAEQSAALGEVLRERPHTLFQSFTTTGSGHGLRIVGELVGRAYGIASVETLVREGYVGAKIVDGSFVSWFHWPLSGA